MNPQERREFVRTHRTAIFGYPRGNDGPALSVVYYVMDGDHILVSTMARRGKAKAVRHNPLVSLCVLDEQWPPTYVTVFCKARIESEHDTVVDLMMRIAGLMAGRPMPEDVRPLVAEGARREERVVLRLTPYATFETPPRHVSNVDDIPSTTHGYGTTMPWDAS